MSLDNLDNHFSLSNIPFGIASLDSDDLRYEAQCVTRIRGNVVFLAVLAEHKYFAKIDVDLTSIFRKKTLNTFSALAKTIHRSVRETIQKLFHDAQGGHSFPTGAIVPAESVTLHLPLHVGDFTDFSVSIEHNYRAAELILGKRFLPPGFLHFPLGYAGRCSSIVVSGKPVQRPLGQYVESKNEDGTSNVVFGPTKALDYELEIGVVVGRPVAQGYNVTAADADEHIFGLVLVNDWSARDIQALEMTPLGPLNGKNFATSMSPWVITLDALEPFREDSRVSRDQPVSPYLRDDGKGNYDISLKVEIISATDESTVVCQSQAKDTLYWNIRQLLAHQAVGGCGLASGDLLATGTVSGSGEDARGCLLESTRGGKQPIALSDGTSRGYLEDGDSVRFTAMAGDGSTGVGFGECLAKVVRATPLP